jgi:hypothetical protein
VLGHVSLRPFPAKCQLDELGNLFGWPIIRSSSSVFQLVEKLCVDVCPGLYYHISQPVLR